MPIVKAKKVKGGAALGISCEHCGKPISKTSDFGMDCEDDCSQKLWNQDRMLAAGIESGMREAPVQLPSFAEYADDEDD